MIDPPRGRDFLGIQTFDSRILGGVEKLGKYFLGG